MKNILIKNSSGPRKTAHILITGIVQGVGFRPFIHRMAVEHSITGKVYNRSGSVFIESTGFQEQLEAFFKNIKNNKSGQWSISSISINYVPITSDYKEFFIAESKLSSETKIIPPDIRTCPRCFNEFRNNQNKRYQYPFISCTNCGPRFTIIKDTPYDRQNTSMSEFKMCKNCLAEYNDISDRRYHAEINACPACGPEVWLADKNGNKFFNDETFIKARNLLKKGSILAVRGLGGFHIACDAANYKTVEKLKRRKQRSDKPLAVMSDSIEKIKTFAELDNHTMELLESEEAPIVLLPWKQNNVLASNIAEGMKHIGVFTPYTPVHYLLFDRDICALVMTSANISAEPIEYNNSEAIRKLSHIADYFILHNREILNPADDSVIKPLGKGNRVILRRSRGYVPKPVYLSKKFPDIIAMGSQYNNTICILKNNMAVMSQHIGDMENKRVIDYFESTIASLIKVYGLEPSAVACDLHPDYVSARFADEFAGKNRIKIFKVQHHYAHMLSVMAEHGLQEKAIGIILDGTGYGDDGNIWGGEFLVGDFCNYRRAAHLSNIDLPGGDIASKEGYRTAISILSGFLEEKNIIKYYKGLPAASILHQLSLKINTHSSSGAGRLFDAAASILGICHISAYESEAAMKLEENAYNKEPSSLYEYEIKKSGAVYIINLMPAFKQLWDKKNDKNASINFHFTLSSALANMTEMISTETGIKNIVLSGGVFQNTILLAILLKLFKNKDYNVLIHKDFSPNDSSIGLGQAVYAANQFN